VSGLTQLELENLPVESVNTQLPTGITLLNHWSIFNAYFITFAAYIFFFLTTGEF
jgi:hypothetical protein